MAHTRAGELRGQVPLLLVCSEHGLSLWDPSATSTSRVARPLSMAEPDPCQGRWVTAMDPVPVPEPPARPEHGTPDGYDDALGVPQEPPAPSTGDISEGVAQRRWICVLPTGKRAHSCPVPSAEALHGRLWLWGWAGIRLQIHGCCSQTPGGACQGGHGAVCPPCTLLCCPQGGIYSPPSAPGATRTPSEQPPVHTDYDDVGSSALGPSP